MSRRILASYSLVIFSLVPLGGTGCGPATIGEAPGTTDFGEEGEPGSADESSTSEALVIASLSNGSRARVAANLNLRTGPSTSYTIIRTMPLGDEVTVLARSGSWYSVDHHGTVGWSHGGYLESLEGGQTGLADEAIGRARSGVGFSYHWGAGCWSPGASSHGACYGSCPSCSHSGQWGADCSAFVTKAWQVPGTVSLTECDHGPYNSSSYYSNRTHWSQVSRSQAKKGDAFVRHGHIFLYGNGDPWGSISAMEAKGCSYGIVQNNRSADSSYIVIRRDGF